MKVEKLKIGNIYYISRGIWDYKKVVLLKIINDKSVLLEDRKGRIFKLSIQRLHKVPYKAVLGYKARIRVRQEYEEMKKREQQKKIESLVAKSVQTKIKQLKRRDKPFATIENDKYIVKEYTDDILIFDTLQELENWVDSELAILKIFRRNVLSRSHKFIKTKNEDGQYDYFKKLDISFPHREIKCIRYSDIDDEIL